MPLFKNRKSPQGPGPSRSTTSKNILRNALLFLEKAVDGLPIPGLKAAAGGLLEIIKIIDKAEQNQDGLRELGAHLRHLQDAIIIPILAQQQTGSSPALEARTTRLTDDLSALARDWQHLKTAHDVTHRHIDIEAYSLAINDLNRKIKESLAVFLLDNQISSAIAIENIQHTVVHVEKHLLGKEIQNLPHANAAYDDYSRNNAPSCFEGTREGVLDEVMTWFINGSTFMFVLLGIAGVGKSTIAQTIAALVAGNDLLAASFFFSRYESDRSTSRNFFPSIAFQLAQQNEDFATRISKALQATPDAAQKTLSQQLQKLIINPLKDVPSTTLPMLVVIDALDECEPGGATEVLQLVLTQLVKLPFIKVFLTTRPEHHLNPTLALAETYNHLVLHDIEASVVVGDIKRFLEHKLSPEEVERVLPGSEWVCGTEDIDVLVRAAGRLFIVASTCEKFIKDDIVGDPQYQMATLLKSFETSSNSDPSAFDVLDALYRQILEAVMPSNKSNKFVTDRFQHVVGSIITLQNPLPPESLAKLLSKPINYVNAVLDRVQSIIVSADQDPCPRIYHPSFPDFITDVNRCKDERFLIETPKHHTRLAGLCLDLMARLLIRNICDLTIHDQYMENENIPDLNTKIKTHIPPELEYACLYWAVHLNKCAHNDESLVKKLEHFAFHHLLFWLEVLSLTGRMDVAYPAVAHARTFATHHDAPLDLQTILDDAHRLIMGSHEIIKISAMHVYYSVLPFIPNKTVLWRQYEKEAKGSVRVVIGRDSEWDLLPLAVLGGHTGGVDSIALSPDGTRLCSGSSDETVRLWDAVSGASLAVMNGHSDSVTSIAFSPNGAHLASASRDKTVRLWNAVSGAPLIVIEGHSRSVTSVVFSPDSTRIASASRDKTIRVWDAASGASPTMLNGHSESVTSVVFSPDSTRLASASDDKTVRVWNGDDGASLAVMRGHSRSVRSVAFSSDGTRLASASQDRTVRVWDSVSGASLAVMRGHSSSVRSAMFSPDSTRIASASRDKTVRVWDAVSGVSLAVMNGHLDSVTSAVFSPEGTRLASSSDDKTVRVWDAASGAALAVMRSHSSSVTSVVFSPDGTRVASASWDKTVRIWNAVSRAPLTIMEGHSDSVTSVVFSPDSAHLASISTDKTMVWDTFSGASLTMMNGPSSSVTSVVFSPNGTRLALASTDKNVRVWDIVPRALHAVPTIDSHSNDTTPPLNSHAAHYEGTLVFTPDGSAYVSQPNNVTHLLWDSSAKVHQTAQNDMPDHPQTAVSNRPKPLLFSRDDRTQSYVIHNSSNRNTELQVNTTFCWLPSRFLEIEHTWGGTTVALLLQGRLMLLDTSALQLE